MITENLSTLKIHKLTQAQYDREVEAGNIDPNALYLTPDEEANIEVDTSLTQSGRAADAKAVGDALALKADADNYYTSLSAAITDINNGVNTNSLTDVSLAKVKVFVADDGKTTAMLLDNIDESTTITVNKDVNISLCGYTLNFTNPSAYLSFASGNCAIFGETEDSRIVKENFEASSLVRLLTATCEHLEIHGGEYILSGTCVNKNAQVFVVGGSNKYCLFEDCTVNANVHSTGAVGAGTTYYLTTVVTNSAENTVIRGGVWDVHTTGNTRATMANNVGLLTVEDAEFVAYSKSCFAFGFTNDSAAVSGATKTGILNIDNCSINVCSEYEGVYDAFGICNLKENNITRVSNTAIFTDACGYSASDGYNGSMAIAVDNAVGAVCHITNVTAHGTHSCLSNRGKMYVNGGTYTGFCHGGIYCSHGADGEAFVNDAYLRDGYYEGIHTDFFAASSDMYGGFYVGGGEDDYCSNMSVYLDNCKIEGFYRAFVMRGTSDEQNNKAYLSNCEMISGDVARGINIHNETHRVYLTNCNYGKENATLPNCVIYTDSLYRKGANDEDLKALVNYANKIVEIVKPMIVTIWTDDNGELVADKTHEEIKKAYDENREVVAHFDGLLLPMVAIADEEAAFLINLTDYSIIATIYADNTVVYDEIELADMIPTKVSQLENDAEFIDLPSCTILGNNLYRRAEVVEGYFISPSSGNPAVAPNCQYATVAIPEIDELTIGFGCYIYAFEASNTGGVSFWDKNMNNLGVLDVKDYKIAYTHNGFPCATLPVPEGAAYVRYTVRMWNSNTGAEKWNANQTMLIAPGTADDVQDPRIATIRGYGVCVAARKKDKKLWALIGDSISAVNTTAMVKYHDYVAQELGLLVSNHARSGAGFTSGTTFSTQIAELAQEDCDIITIFTSGNDCDNDPPLGQVTDTGTDTLCGVINTTLDELFALKPFVSVGIITSCPWKWFMPSTPGNLMENYNNAIMEIARRRGIPVLDLYHSSNMRPDDEGFRVKFYNENGVQDNGVHPNSEGHKILAAPIREFVRSLIRP